jgi:hypothetical protein
MEVVIRSRNLCHVSWTSFHYNNVDLVSGTFWKAQGDAMGISFDVLGPSESGLDFVKAIQAWSDAYEQRCMVPDVNNNRVADETTKLLLYDVPDAAKPFGKLAVSALLTDRLRTAMMYPVPPTALMVAIQNALMIRKYILRWFALPRPRFLRQRKVMDQADSKGRLFSLEYQAEPW